MFCSYILRTYRIVCNDLIFCVSGDSFPALFPVYFRCSPALQPIHYSYAFVTTSIGNGGKRREKRGRRSIIH